MEFLGATYQFIGKREKHLRAREFTNGKRSGGTSDYPSIRAKGTSKTLWSAGDRRWLTPGSTGPHAASRHARADSSNVKRDPMQQVIGTAHITERADSVAPVHDWEAFLSAAKSMDIGIRILAQSLPEATLPLAILCGHASECGLKALLSHSGIKTNVLRSKSFGHNLVALWIAAASCANLQPSVPPAWIEQLGRVHGEPYILRYPIGVHGIVLPATQPMLAGTAELLSFAQARLGTGCMST
jgi:hypothetical protein